MIESLSDWVIARLGIQRRRSVALFCIIRSMLKRLRERWGIYSGIIIFLIIRSFEPFKSNRLLALAVAVVIGIVIAVLMAIIAARPSHSAGRN